MTNKMGDLKEAGIIDPLKVVKMAFTNAVSVAANYLTIGAAVVNLPRRKARWAACLAAWAEKIIKGGTRLPLRFLQGKSSHLGCLPLTQVLR